MSLNGKNIVIVDDERNFAESIAMYLEDLGARTDVFENSVKSLEFISKSRGIDLVIADLRMPEMDGLELIERIKSLGKDIPVIVLSATDDVKQAIESVKTGAKDFLSKPIYDLGELEICVSQVLNNASNEAELKHYRKHLEELVEERTAQLADANRTLQAEVVRRKNAELQVKQGTAKIFRALEEDRSRISKELHDSIGQKLVVAKLHLAQIKTNGNKDAEHVKSALETVQDTASEISEIVTSLYPQAIEKYSLSENLDSLIGTLNSSSAVNFSFEFSGSDDTIQKDEKLNIYRVFQEALNNIVKHSGAKSANVILNCSGDRLRGTISDDGAGFSTDTDDYITGAGLFSMKERIEHLSGIFQLESSKETGTKISFEVPI